MALTGIPVPNTLSLAAVAAAFGKSNGFRYMAVLKLGMAAVIAIIGSGVSSFIFTVPGGAPVITVIAGLYFIYLAYRIATASPLQATAELRSETKWFEGVLLSLINPRAYAIIAALFSSSVPVSGNQLLDSLFKAAVLMLAIIVVNIFGLFAGSTLTRCYQDERMGRVINITFAVLLVVSVAVTLML